MGSRNTEIDERTTADDMPADVAVLYSWAKLQGAKYRDYSASRREYRAQVRYGAAKALLEREVQAQEEAAVAAGVAVAEKAERSAFSSEAVADATTGDRGEGRGVQALLAAMKAARGAAAERMEAARRAESSARLAVLALREEREIAEAHTSAKRQAMVYEGTEARRRQLAGPQPYGLPGEEDIDLGREDREIDSDVPEEMQQFLFSDWRNLARDPIAEALPERSFDPDFGTQSLFAAGGTEAYRGMDDLDGEQGSGEMSTPAWLHSAEAPARSEAVQGSSPPFWGELSTADTLLDSRERVASRWFALKGVFEDAGEELAGMQPVQPIRSAMPLLAVFSLAGGVGKTSLAAAVARGLSLLGERVLLTDTTSQGLLPIYFGLHELRAGEVRRVTSSAEGSVGTISLAMHGHSGEDGRRDLLVEQIVRSGQGNDRVVLDLATGSDWLIRRMADLHPTVLVPIAPDINSVMSLQAVERLFGGILDSQRRPLLPLYVLNQFDASLPLHLDIREVFRRRLGNRLAQVAIRRSPTVGEALAEGMTALDYAAEGTVAQDYIDVVAWLRSVSPSAGEELRGLRWGER
jgi:cellulose synthase operon protein YhjQ